MSSQKRSSSRRVSTAEPRTDQPGGPQPSWWRTARLALALFAGLLLVVYLLGAIWSLVGFWLAGGQVSVSGASLSDALSYPFKFAWTPSWLDAGLGAALVFAFALSLFGVRVLDAPQPAVARASVGAAKRTLDPTSATRRPQPHTAAPAPAPSAEPPNATSSRSAEPNVATDFKPRVFISHSSLDNTFGYRLVSRLREALGGENFVWYDSAPGRDGTGLIPGDEWWNRITAELAASNVFLIILSPNSMDSAWCRDELTLAWKDKNAREQSRRKVIIPLLYRTCAVPEYLLTVQTADFTDDATFEAAFEQLLRAVRAGRTIAAPTVESGPPFDLAQLPLPAHFVGRQKELAFLRERLTARGSTTGIVAVNGLGGIGKTGLAAKVIRELREAGRFPGGIAVALCQDKRTEADALQILADVLTRFDPQRRPPEATVYAGLAEAATRLLKGKETLVVLDNVEPELPIERVVVPLREAGATLLLTARQKQTPDVVPLEGRLALDLLSEDEALDLLARSLGRPAALDLTRDELAAAKRIVENLDRHTLAVTLAAAYVADEVGPTLAQLADQLADPQRALHLPKGEAPAEVKRVFASSYDALPADAQRLFAALAAFPTPEFGREAALALAEALEIADREPTMELLVRRALATAQGERLRLHPLIQALAAGELTEWLPSEREQTERAVVAYYAYYANATPDLALVPDEANIVGAIEWAHAHNEDRLVARLCIGMARFWRDTGRTRTGLAYLPWGIEAGERVADQTQDAADRRRAATIASYYGDFLRTAGRLPEAEAVYQRDLVLRRQLGDRNAEGVTLDDLGQIARQRGQLDEAQRLYEESLAIKREIGNRREEGVTLNNLGLVAQDRGQLAEAQRLYEASLAIWREVGDHAGEGATLDNLGQIARQRGQLAEALRLFEESLAIRREVGDRPGEGVTLSNLAVIARMRGQLAEAQELYEASLAIAREVGDRGGEGTTLNNLGLMAQDRGRLEEAQRLYEEALAIARETEYAELEAAASESLAAVMRERQEANGAEA